MILDDYLWTVAFLATLTDIVLRFVAINVERQEVMVKLKKFISLVEPKILVFCVGVLVFCDIFGNQKMTLYTRLLFFLWMVLLCGIVIFNYIDDFKKRSPDKQKTACADAAFLQQPLSFPAVPIPASACISDPDELVALVHRPADAIRAVHERYPLRVSRHFLELALKTGEPLLKQVIPDPLELADEHSPADPLNEENLSPVPGLIHRYPDRAVLLACLDCASYCRFCTRKRRVGRAEGPDAAILAPSRLEAALDYLRATPAIADVLISGGDPLMLSDEQLERLVAGLRSVPSVRLIRIGSRMPCMYPARVTEQLARMLAKYHPLYMNLHFNHPAELCPEAVAACGRLADAGIPLGAQTVLLRGVNDSAPVLKELFYRLLEARVRPYYLFQLDQTRGTAHFRTSIDQGQALMRELVGFVSGMAVPRYALDTPGGGGKIPLTPSYVDELGADCVFTTYNGTRGRYPNGVWPAPRPERCRDNGKASPERSSKEAFTGKQA